MFLASKIAWAGVVFILVATGISGPRLVPLAAEPSLRAEPDPRREVPAVLHQSDIKGMQETLRDKGHYGSKVDGVFGLHTRASIREFQKAENLPITGQLDPQTAGRLGVEPEARGESGYEMPQDKPSAGVTWLNDSARTTKRLQKPVKRSPPTVPTS